ncbi:MAG: glycosyltransferase family 4 protein [Leptolyngbyaceae cyanobacterium]
MQHTLNVNLSFLASQPTGISNYALNIVPALRSLSPQLFTPFSVAPYSAEAHHFLSPQMSTDCGRRGHIHRLLWLQFGSQAAFPSAKTALTFTPLPEAPLWRNSRYITTAHDTIPLRFPAGSGLLNQYFKYYVPHVLRRAEHVICDSKTTAADIMDAYDIPLQRVTPIYLGYDKTAFRPLALPTQNYFLYVGLHSPHKNLIRLIQAFGQLQHRETELWIAGSGNARYTPQLEACVAEWGLGDRVRFLGYVPQADLPRLINQALAFVFPSLWEGFGLPILEAMACGTPVITSNCASMPEVAGEAALLINPYQVPELTQAMENICRDASLQKELCRQGLERVKQFSWAKTGAATAEILRAFSR